MNKKGFTLIELLAVIVILAIIALIATPIVLNIIDDAKNESDLRSAEFYLKSLELSIAQATLKGTNIKDKVYSIMSNGNVCLEEYKSSVLCEDNDGNPDNNELIVEVKGKKATSGTIVIENGQIVDKLSTNENSKTELVINDQTIVMKDGELKHSSEKVETLGGICIYDTSSRVAAKTVGAKYSCDLGDGERFFYVLEVKANEVSLILNENLNTNTYNYCDDLENCNTDKLTGKLYELTSNWTKLEREQISLPSIEHIMSVESQIDENGGSISESNKWLYEWEGNDIYNNEDNGYWTSYLDYDNALYVDGDGNVNFYVGDTGYYGIRPVINLKI